MGRKKRVDDEALRRVHELVEGEGLDIRPAFRQVGKERGWPDWRVGALEEWGRKEYARRRDDGTLPEGHSLPEHLVAGIEAIFNQRERIVEKARQAINDCRRRAPELELDLDDLPSDLLDSLKKEHDTFIMLNSSSAETVTDHFARLGVTTLEGVLARMREMEKRNDLVFQQIKLLELYMWALGALARNSSPESG